MRLLPITFKKLEKPVTVLCQLNGLDPATCVHLIKIYVLPVLTYGLEIILPKKKHIDRLNLFLKTLLKQVLSLPTQCADPVPYILSGLLPIEAQIHIKALNFF